MRAYGAYILDLDGTLFRGEQPIEGAVEVVQAIRKRGAILRFLTNNSTRTREDYVVKLRRLGFEVELGEIYTSALGTAHYLIHNNLNRVYVVGEPGLVETLRTDGITVAENQVQAVVVGLSRSFDYDTMNHAMQLVRGGAKFIATNRDATYPIEGGGLTPGAGSVVAAIATCCEVEPFVIGKPNPFLIEMILEEGGLDRKATLVVGDRLETDVESGLRAGCDTFLVLSGVTTQAPENQPSGPDLRSLL